MIEPHWADTKVYFDVHGSLVVNQNHTEAGRIFLSRDQARRLAAALHQAAAHESSPVWEVKRKVDTEEAQP